MARTEANTGSAHDDAAGRHPIDWDQLPLSRSSVNRAAHLRTEPDFISRLRTDPSTRVVLVHGADVAVTAGGTALAVQTAPALAGIDLGDDSSSGPVPVVRWLFLGADDDGAVLALVVPRRPVDDQVGIEGIVTGGDLFELVQGQNWAPLREVGEALDAADAGLATTAVALAAWHSANTRCPRCGAKTDVIASGWVRRCAADGSEHYPRTDPAVIMAVIDDDDRLLLGHARHWPEGRFSTLAGYVEPGEGLEAAVRREVLEESAIVVGDVEYRGSQPWPFPASLMFGFWARATTTEITVDNDEVTDARWFTRAQLEEEAASGRVRLPMGTSIARALIEDWFGGPIAQGPNTW